MGMPPFGHLFDLAGIVILVHRYAGSGAGSIVGLGVRDPCLCIPYCQPGCAGPVHSQASLRVVRKAQADLL